MESATVEDPKNAGQKPSQNILADGKIGQQCHKIALSGGAWTRPSSCGGDEIAADDDELNSITCISALKPLRL